MNALLVLLVTVAGVVFASKNEANIHIYLHLSDEHHHSDEHPNYATKILQRNDSLGRLQVGNSAWHVIHLKPSVEVGDEVSVVPEFPIGAYTEPESLQPDETFCPNNGMVVSRGSTSFLTPNCVPPPGPVRCFFQLMTTGNSPIGTVCANEGYMSGWTKIPKAGPFRLKCCSSADYTYDERSCRISLRTPKQLDSDIPPQYFPVGGKAARGRPGFYVKSCIFIRRKFVRKR